MAEARISASPGGQVELVLHTACVKAGAYALAHRVIRALPLAKPFLASSLRKNLSGNTPAKIQVRLIRDIYRRYGLKPANWEIAAILAVASFSAQGMSDLEGDDSAKRCGVWSSVFVLFCLIAIFALSGCAEVRTLYHACRDGHCS